MNSRSLAIISIALPFAAVATQAMARSGDVIPDSYICVFNKAVNQGGVSFEANRMVSGHAGQVTRLYRYSIRGFATHMSAQAVARMTARNPSIAYCEPDRVIELGPIREEAKPGGGSSSGQTTPWGITWVRGGLSGAGKTAWIIDTGIDSTHPDLVVDTSRGHSFVPRETSTEDLNGHGTHVSGTIAARNNGIGVIGVAADATVVPVRVLDRRGSGAYSDVIAGVDWVAQHAAAGDVANMSLGGPADDALDAAVLAASAKVRFAIAAGNSGADANKYSPARVNGTTVYTVSAFDRNGTFAYFSNYGNPPVDFSEPGVSILSTWKGSGYNTISGTSMAAPHLAGLLLLGAVNAGGTVKGDKDSAPDTIGVH